VVCDAWTNTARERADLFDTVVTPALARLEEDLAEVLGRSGSNEGEAAPTGAASSAEHALSRKYHITRVARLAPDELSQRLWSHHVSLYDRCQALFESSRAQAEALANALSDLNERHSETRAQLEALRAQKERESEEMSTRLARAKMKKRTYKTTVQERDLAGETMAAERAHMVTRIARLETELSDTQQRLKLAHRKIRKADPTAAAEYQSDGESGDEGEGGGKDGCARDEFFMFFFCFFTSVGSSSFTAFALLSPFLCQSDFVLYPSFMLFMFMLYFVQFFCFSDGNGDGTQVSNHSSAPLRGLPPTQTDLSKDRAQALDNLQRMLLAAHTRLARAEEQLELKVRRARGGYCLMDCPWKSFFFFFLN
jgi:hypothetical protein